jgi:hypothetical protein
LKKEALRDPVTSPRHRPGGKRGCNDSNRCIPLSLWELPGTHASTTSQAWCPSSDGPVCCLCSLPSHLSKTDGRLLLLAYGTLHRHVAQHFGIAYLQTFQTFCGTAAAMRKIARSRLISKLVWPNGGAVRGR